MVVDCDSMDGFKNAKDAYDRFDIDGDGEISYEELLTGLGGEYTANEINAIFAELPHWTHSVLA